MKHFLLIFLSVFFICSPTMAKDNLDHRGLLSIPVQHDGRIKPLSSFSKSILYAYSGHNKINGMSSTEWLLMSLFDPSRAIQTPVFRIFQPELFGLSKKEKPYFSLAEIAPRLQDHMDEINEIEQKIC